MASIRQSYKGSARKVTIKTNASSRKIAVKSPRPVRIKVKKS